MIEFKGKITGLEAKLEESKTAQLESQGKVTALDTKLEESQGKIDDLERDRDMYKHNAERHEQSADERQEKIAELSAELRESKGEVQALDTKLEKSEEALRESQEKVQALEAKLDRSSMQLNTKLTESKAQVNALKHEIAGHKTALVNAEAGIKELKDTKEELKRASLNLAGLKKQMDEDRTKNLEEISNLMATVGGQAQPTTTSATDRLTKQFLSDSQNLKSVAEEYRRLLGEQEKKVKLLEDNRAKQERVVIDAKSKVYAMEADLKNATQLAEKLQKEKDDAAPPISDEMAVLRKKLAYSEKELSETRINKKRVEQYFEREQQISSEMQSKVGSLLLERRKTYH